MGEFTNFPFYAHTADDVAAAERDLDALIARHEVETDPAFKALYADWIELDTMFLNEMRDAVYPALPFPVVVPSMPWRLHP